MRENFSKEISNTFMKHDAVQLIKYLNNTWFKRFSINIWNIHNTPIWTNNTIENSNKDLNNIFSPHEDKIKFIETAYQVNKNNIIDWEKFTQIKKTYPAPQPYKLNKKRELINLSKEFWSNEKLDNLDISSSSTIQYINLYLHNLTNIRIKYDTKYKLSSNISINSYLSSKSLANNSKQIKQCKICKLKIHYSLLNDHLLNCNAVCNLCTKNCQTKQKLKQHLKNHKNYNYFCQTEGCNKKYKYLNYFLKHKNHCSIKYYKIQSIILYLINNKLKSIYYNYFFFFEFYVSP